MTGGPAHEAGVRAVRNTVARAAGEIGGKLASLALFVVLGREVGQSGLGAFVFAFAFLLVASVPVDLGYDRYLVRAIAKDRDAARRLLFDVMALKLVRVVPVAVVAVPLLFLLAPSAEARQVVYALSAGVLIDALSRTLFAVYTAYERNDLVAIGLIAQRGLGAALGIVALAKGYGVVTVAAAYSAGAAAGFALTAALIRRAIGRPGTARTAGRAWRELTRESMPFAVQDVFTVMLFRIDAIILAAIATQAAVGRYGAAYRLFESTLFISISLASAFAAMYTYLGPDTEPSIRAIFQRSIKLSLVALVPIAVAFGLLAEPLTRLVFGAGLEPAADALRILAPAVVMMGIVTLSSSLFVSRHDPRRMVRVTALMGVLNIALNLALIPALEEKGAAIAMLVTEVLYAAVALRLAVRAVDGVSWRAMAASPLAGGAAMVPLTLALSGSLAAALVAGALAYLVVYVVVERAIAPVDLRFATDMLRRMLRIRPTA
jgi:O-antigen/teichoic acid export membrane protein